ATAPAPAEPAARRDSEHEYSLSELLRDAELRRQEKEARENAMEQLDSGRDLDDWEGNASDGSDSVDDHLEEEQSSTGNSSFEIVDPPTNPEPIPFTLRQPLPSNQRLAEAMASSSSNSVPKFDFGSFASKEWSNDGTPKTMFTFGAQQNDSSISL